MKLNPNGIIARFYLFPDDTDDLPDNFCTFFWRLVGRVALLALLAFIASILVIWVLKLAQLMWAYPVRALVGVAIGATVPTLILIVMKLKRRPPSELWIETMKIVHEKKNSIKEHYCPRIDWSK